MSDAEETLRRSGELLDRAVRWDALQGIGAEREAVAKAVAEERVAVVAWLRVQARAQGASPDERTILTWASNHIDRGEHRREEER